MQECIEFIKELIYLIILWKVLGFFLTGRIRSKSKHKILVNLFRLIRKMIVYLIVSLERKLDSKMRKSHQSCNSNVIQLKHRTK